MQTIGKRVEQLTLRGLWVALLTIFAMGLLAPQTHAQTSANNTIVNQTVPLAALSSDGTGAGTKGGWGGASAPTGETFVVDSHGNVIVGTNWAGSLLSVNTATGAVTEPVTGDGNLGPVAIDTAGNIYFGNTYGANIYKIPAGTTIGSTLPTAVCTGAVNTTTDTSPCQFALNLQDTTGYYGVTAIAIDPSGNFWIATNQWPGAATNNKAINNQLLVCNAACQTGAQYQDAPVVAFDDSSNPTDELGEFAFDPWGNVFFTLSNINEAGPGAGGNATNSYLEMTSPNGSGGYYAPSVVLSYTNNQTYSNALGGVAIDPTSGTVYFTTNADGIFAIPNSQANGPNTSAMYTVSTVGGKGIALDANGNLYQIAYGTAFYAGGSDLLEQILVNNVTTPITGQQQTMDVPLTVIDNGAAVCTATGQQVASTLNFTFGGTNASQFTASVTAPTAPATSSCATQGVGGTSPVPLGVAFPITLAYTPTSTGTSIATMATTDAVTNATGTAMLTGISEKPQVISFSTSLTWTYSSGLTIALQASGGRSGNPVTFTLVSGPAKMDATVANQLDVSGPGTIVVEANQAGNATYAAAPTLTKSIVVSPIAQSITWNPAPPRNLSYTGTALNVTLSATGGASGSPVVFTVDGASTAGIASIAGNALTITGLGTVIVDANQAADAAGDYSAAPQVQATIVVSAALLPTGPPIIVSQTTALNYVGPQGGGGVTASSNPDGGTMAIDPMGDAVVGATYGKQVIAFNINNTNPGYQTVLDDGDTGGAGTVAVDGTGNVFVGETYGGAPYILKIPYGSSGYTPLTTANFPAKTVLCTGNDQSACWMGNVTAGSVYPVVAMVFDAAGDLFYGIQNNSSGAGTSGITSPDSIWECDVNCLYGGGTSPVMLFQEPPAGTTTLSPSTSVQLTLGSIAVDANDNIFFTDAAIDASSLIHYSDLNELANNGGTYPATATVLVTNIPSSPGQYVGAIDAVSIDPTHGDVYFSDEGAVYAFMDNAAPGSALDPQTVNATMWTVSPQGAKLLAVVPGGSAMYQAAYSKLINTGGQDTMFYTAVGSVTVPGTVLDGSSATVPPAAPPPVTSLYAVLNDGNCTTPETLTFTSPAAEYSAVQGATCSGTFTQGSWFTSTLTFAPVSPDSGAVQSAIAVSDTAGNSGTFTATGMAQNLIPQTITAFAGITSPVTYGAGSTTGGGTYTLSATGGQSGNPVVFSIDAADSTAGVATVSGNTLTITGTGTLYIFADQAGNTQYQAAPEAKFGPFMVNPAAQTIAFGGSLASTTATAPLVETYGASPIAVSVSNTNVSGPGSGQPITLTLDPASTAGAATLAGNTLTFTGVGTVIIDANQAASTTGDYLAATQVQAFIQVGMAAQTITLTPSVTTQVYPNTVSLTATASSGLPVTLTETAGSSIATLTGTTLTPTGTAFGTVTVQAAQAGNSNYSAAPAQTVSVTYTAIGTVATPAITPAAGTLFTNGSPANTVTITDATTGAIIWYTLDGTNPLTSSTALQYTAPFTLAITGSPYTVTAAASLLGYVPSTTASAQYTISNLPPNFTATVSPGAVDLSPGTSAIVDINITPNASFLGTVSFSCSGAPSGVSCAFSPATLTATGSGNLTTVLTISDVASTAGNRRGPNPFIPGGATFALALCFLGFRKRRNLVLGLVLLAGIFGLTQLTGCGSGGGLSSKGSTTSSMTVTATSTYGGTVISQTLPVTITIRK